MEKSLTCSTEMRYRYSQRNKDFKIAYASFSEHIQRGGSVDDMMEHVSHNIIHFGYDSMIEGIGYVKPKNKKWNEIRKPHSGIELLSDNFPRFDYQHD